jgi:superfamily I DNA/RNA helicase
VRLRSGDQLASRFDSYTFHAFAKRIVDNYRVLLTGQNELDPNYTLDARTRTPRTQITFADLVTFAVEILQTSSYARNGLRQTYSHVFLDEFQDATTTQYELLREAFLNSGVLLTAVGDVKQRIMGFAGALDGIMEKFSEDFTAVPLPLYQNFRSAPVLRRMQNRMIQVLDPAAAVATEELVGDEGNVETLAFTNAGGEAAGIANLIEGWLETGVPPSEIAVLVRQQPHVVGEELAGELAVRGIAFRNEQARQDLTVEPAAAMIFDLLRVLAGHRQAAAYGELTRLVRRSGVTEEMAQRSANSIMRFLADKRRVVHNGEFKTGSFQEWSTIVEEFLELVTRPVLTALSPEYQRGSRLDGVIFDALAAFEEELTKDDSPNAALGRLSEVDAVRILTIHKCKGLEFEKVVVMGVEEQLFWSEIDVARAEFFVAISRAKHELYLTTTQFRKRPRTATGRWDERRTPHREFLGFVTGSPL